MIIKGFDNYEVYSDGRIYSYLSNKYMKLVLNKGTGYLQVGLTNDGKVTNLQVHRLVANHFIVNKYNKSQVNHINGIKTDNDVSNLEWVTDSENKLHCYSTGLKSRNIISKPIYQLEKYTDIILREFESANKASRVLGVNQGNISNCCIGNCKSAYGYSWRYVD